LCWNETHDRLSRIMMPGVDPKVIYRVNRAMDNPDPWSIYLNRYMKNLGVAHAFDVPGLRKYGHREPNHNWMSAMMTGYMYGGKEGDVRCCCCKPPYARPHDRYADTCTVGYAGRDLFESMLNYGLVVNHHSYRRRPVRSRARPESSRGGGREKSSGGGGRYIAVIDMVAYKMCCILILVHLEYPPPVMRQLHRRIILAIVRKRERGV
jgi:hypothetical protein